MPDAVIMQSLHSVRRHTVISSQSTVNNTILCQTSRADTLAGRFSQWETMQYSTATLSTVLKILDDMARHGMPCDGLPSATAAAAVTTFSSVGFRIHTFPAGLL